MIKIYSQKFRVAFGTHSDVCVLILLQKCLLFISHRNGILRERLHLTKPLFSQIKKFKKQKKKYSSSCLHIFIYFYLFNKIKIQAFASNKIFSLNNNLVFLFFFIYGVKVF